MITIMILLLLFYCCVCYSPLLFCSPFSYSFPCSEIRDHSWSTCSFPQPCRVGLLISLFWWWEGRPTRCSISPRVTGWAIGSGPAS